MANKKPERARVEPALPASVARNDAVPATWFLYMIECADGSIYTGIALDVAARYQAHASGKGARYTRAHPPARVLASIAYPDRSSASQAEYRVKQLKATEKRIYAAQLSAGVSAKACDDKTAPAEIA